MMKRLVLALLLALPLSLRAADAPAANGAKPEALAGEDDKAVPTAVPTPAADVRGPVNVTRSAQGASAFHLPDFVVTGSGERKAMARRDGQASTGLDTSGGFKTSPGEKGAGKDQLETKAERSSPEDRTYSAKASDGWLRGAYGLANTGSLDGYVGHSTGPWALGLQGGVHTTDGAALPAGLGFTQRRDAALQGNLSYALGELDRLDLQADGQTRSRRWARGPADASLERDAAEAVATWAGEWEGNALSFEAGGQKASQRLPAVGTLYTEEGGGVALKGQRTLSGRTGQTTLLFDASLEALSQAWSGQRQRLLWKGSLQSRFEPFNRARLTLGLGVDAISGDDNELLLGPRVLWQQRLSPAWGWEASFTTGLQLSRLRGPEWAQDARLPDPLLGASRQVGDLEVALMWQAAPGLSLEARAFGKQNDAYFMADDPAMSGLWADTPVGGYRELGGQLKARRQGLADWQELLVRYLRPEIADLPGATPTFAPSWTGRAAAGLKLGAWHGSLSVDFRSEQEARLRAGWTQPAAADLGADLGYDFNPAFTAFAEGRNLAAANVGADPDALDPSPYVGAGVELRF